ncbi:PEP-CTERM sorting domain-containing protein [Salinimonas marina]|uniref:PEP-CTERM sorting domain-containing protein n=1 Tax=Salinimonas marina TaxID=2785918 RepID=A0A7S9HBM3_9ALTE|nr:PEP-CTERM sorting domain-containing protein [Salinimonas marina]QPG04341.1 PEP-CTERM sorting domain-containing protein [Salinimonas marina]
MYKINQLLGASLLLAGTHTMAAPIVNGDFSQCDFGGWTTETVGGGTIDEQFSIVETPQGCSAALAIDNSPSFINLMYQDIDFTTTTTAPFVFSYDFTVDSVLTGQAPGSTDYFALGLGDGSGNLFNAQGEVGSFFGMPDIDGTQRYQGSIELANIFANNTGLSLELQMFSNFDGAPAFITVNTLSIAQASIPAPATAALLLLGLLAGGFSRRCHTGGNA